MLQCSETDGSDKPYLLQLGEQLLRLHFALLLCLCTRTHTRAHLKKVMMVTFGFRLSKNLLTNQQGFTSLVAKRERTDLKGFLNTNANGIAKFILNQNS